MERARLELLDEGLAAREDYATRQAGLDEREGKLNADADARLIKKRKALEDEFLKKAQDIRAQERDTYEKIKKQEGRHTDKIRVLDDKLALADQEVLRLHEGRDSAR